MIRLIHWPRVMRANLLKKDFRWKSAEKKITDICSCYVQWKLISFSFDSKWIYVGNPQPCIESKRLKIKFLGSRLKYMTSNLYFPASVMKNGSWKCIPPLPLKIGFCFRVISAAICFQYLLFCHDEQRAATKFENLRNKAFRNKIKFSKKIVVALMWKVFFL